MTPALIAIILLKIALVIAILLGAVAYLTFAERKVIGYMQDRKGPNRVGPFGLLQPVADGLKLLMKELLTPSAANGFLYRLAPVLTLIPALAAWAVIPFGPNWVLANINAGLLYLFAMTSIGVYGVIIAGWASNSKYALYGALRSSAQVVSYELGMGFALVGVVMAAGSMNLNDIITAQSGGVWHWFFIPLFPLFIVYAISGVAETNRAPFDVVEGESEIVAGHHVEYSGIRFAAFFLAEYANMILISALIATFFMGGWLSPFQGILGLETLFAFIPGFIWLFIKIGICLFFYLWLRATLPRYRYDQIMRLGWKVFLPLTLIWLVVVVLMIQGHLYPWFE